MRKNRPVEEFFITVSQAQERWNAETIEAMEAARRGELISAGKPSQLMAGLNAEMDDVSGISRLYDCHTRHS